MKPFRFKLFSAEHTRSAMKIGVDGVLLGAWADVSECRRILDVGCGCGLIALMCAQRNPAAAISAIDVDAEAVEEASGNFVQSPWAGRLEAHAVDFIDMESSPESYDLIISNPPFFDSGVDNGISARMMSRHQGTLSPLSLIEKGSELIGVSGRIAMIIPRIREEEVICHASRHSLFPTRITRVRGNTHAEIKRSLVELKREHVECRISELILESAPGVPTDEYRALCKDFYLKF